MIPPRIEIVIDDRIGRIILRSECLASFGMLSVANGPDGWGIHVEWTKAPMAT